MRRALVGLVALALVATGASCAGKKKRALKGAAEVLSADETLRRVDDAMARHQLRKAKTLLEKIQFTAEERPVYEPLVRLALADATYYLGDDLSLIEARSKYLDFVTLYGDHPKAPYAQFQAGMCSVKQIASPTRDQAETQVALDDFAEIDKRWPNSRYAQAAKQFIAKGRDALAEHEFIVGNFYRKKGDFDAAVGRFRSLLDGYPHFGERDKVLYWLGWTLVKGRDPSQGRVYLDEVVRDYPKSKFVDEARKLLAPSAHKGERAGADDLGAHGSR